MKASKVEINLVRSQVSTTFRSAETISVDTEFSEVCFYVSPIEYDKMRKNISSPQIDFNYEKSDRNELMLYFKYKIKQS